MKINNLLLLSVDTYELFLDCEFDTQKNNKEYGEWINDHLKTQSSHHGKIFEQLAFENKKNIVYLGSYLDGNIYYRVDVEEWINLKGDIENYNKIISRKRKLNRLNERRINM
jgi:hypothetical protein